MKPVVCKEQYQILFPRLCLVRNYSQTDDLNRQLVDLIEKDRSENESRFRQERSSTQGGYHTSPEFLGTQDAAISEFKNQLLIPAALDYMRQYYQAMQTTAEDLHPSRLEFTGWGNIIDAAGEWNSPHNHINPHNRLSAVYYLEAPERPYPEGVLELTNPDAISIQHGNYGCMKLAPTTGDLIIFPCYQNHFSHPLTTADRRVLIAVDIRVHDSHDQLHGNVTRDQFIKTLSR